MEDNQSTSTNAFCANCGRQYAADDLLSFQGSRICAECKPVFEQRLREGTSVVAKPAYASIWARVGASLLDGLIMAVVNLTVNSLFSSPGPVGFRVFVRPPFFVNTAFGCLYSIFFVSQYGATPGLMALGIKVVTAEGGPISVPLAVGRYFAQWLNVFTLGIGYLIACFDDQNRTLHDHICGTRVIKSR